MSRSGNCGRWRAGNIYIGDNANRRVRRASPAGIIETTAGTGVVGFTRTGPAMQAQLHQPTAALGPDGRVYFVEVENNALRRLDAQGNIETLIP